MHKNKEFALSVFKKQTPTVRVCINAAVNALRCVLEKENLFVRFYLFYFFYINISQLTAPSRGKALSVDFFPPLTPLLPSTANREQPKIKDIDLLLRN